MPNTNPNQTNQPTGNSAMNLQNASIAIQGYIKAFNDAFMFRKEEIEILVLSLIIRKNACFVGSHGEAKSALIEQFAKGIDKKFFGCQFNRFSTPDEILGHFSLSEMKNNDQYVRKYQGKLPDTEIAYLDECFNASGAMLQSLQKALNEKRIDLGNGTELSIPMELAIASTNFHCSKNPQLSAFWDRFFFRIETKNTVKQFNKKNFKKFLKLKRSGKLGKVDQKLSNSIIEFFRGAMETATIPEHIDTKLYEIINTCTQNKIEISARRLVWIDDALKASALINGRATVNECDLDILKNCLWIHIDQYNQINSIVTKYSNTPMKDLKLALQDLEDMKINFIKYDKEMKEEVNKPSPSGERMESSRQNRKKEKEAIEAKVKEIYTQHGRPESIIDDDDMKTLLKKVKVYEKLDKIIYENNRDVKNLLNSNGGK